MTSVQSPAPALHWEKIGIGVAAAAYLTLFSHTLPHGDAMRIVHQIQTAALVWNPNHLLLDPLGYGAYRLAGALGLGLTPLDCFEVLSAVATIVSLLLFHSVLARAGVSAALPRLVGVAGLFGTASFLSLAGSQYFFMTQMPFLIGALYLYVDRFGSTEPAPESSRHLYGIGVLLAFATTIMFNNLLLVGAMGLTVGLSQRSWRAWDWRSSARVWAGAAAIGFPVFVAGYLLSDTSANLVSWLLAYGGDAQSSLNNVYGTKWNIASLIQGVAVVGFNLALGNMVELAGLATVISTMARGQPLEFLPQWTPIGLGLVVVPLVLAFHVAVAFYALRRIPTEPAVRVLSAWILAFATFNFLWKAGDDIFWLQITPATWLLFLMWLGSAPRLLLTPPPERRRISPKMCTHALTVFVALLLAVNTFNAILPVSSDSFARNQTTHAALLREGDLEIFPGWDQQKWIVPDENAPPVRQLLLMNMAVSAPGSNNSLPDLPRIIEAQLRGGGRVIVGRLYDKDEDQLPWYGLAGQGWPREKIQGLLGTFCNRPLADIDGVVIRELYLCEATGTSE